MVQQGGEYKWSSYAGNAGLMQDKLLTPHVEYLALGEREAVRHRSYRQLFSEADDGTFLADIREATNGGYPLLGERMKAQLAAASDRPLERRKPGPAPAGVASGGDSHSGKLPL